MPPALIVALFFVSGALALVYELVRARTMMHVPGSPAVAVGTVLAAFMVGLPDLCRPADGGFSRD